MTEIDQPVQRELDRWRVAGGIRDWDDVRKRAARRPRVLTRGRLAIAAVGALLVVAAAPALPGGLLHSSESPQPQLRATAGGVSFEAWLVNTWVVRRGPRGELAPVVATRRNGVLITPGARIAWRLRSEGSSDVLAARIVAGGRTIDLCRAACRRDSVTTLRLDVRTGSALVNRRAFLEVDTAAGTSRSRISFRLDRLGVARRP